MHGSPHLGNCSGCLCNILIFFILALLIFCHLGNKGIWVFCNLYLFHGDNIKSKSTEEIQDTCVP
ncbi:hypothetical protein D7V86_06195 [bacterium D16-51]|nr:hypothetical protein D7V96_06480 [bacterium D16-59]RKI61364.1 hypothetical protein D7V86_06195 [bacterium D16-51]